MADFETRKPIVADLRGHDYVTGLAEVQPRQSPSEMRPEGAARAATGVSEQSKRIASSVFRGLEGITTTVSSWGRRHPVMLLGVVFGLGFLVRTMISRPRGFFR